MFHAKHWRVLLLGALAAGGAAIGASQAVGDTASLPGASTPATRADLILKATKAELAQAGITIDSISLAATTGGYEVYSLKGASSVCILAARTTQVAGHSTQLSCTDRKAAEIPNAPMVSQLQTDRGLADLAWRPDGATAVQGTVGKVAAETISGGNVAIVVRPTGEAGSLSWKTATGERSTAALPSAAAVKQQAALGGPTG